MCTRDDACERGAGGKRFACQARVNDRRGLFRSWMTAPTKVGVDEAKRRCWFGQGKAPSSPADSVWRPGTPSYLLCRGAWRRGSRRWAGVRGCARRRARAPPAVGIAAAPKRGPGPRPLPPARASSCPRPTRQRSLSARRDSGLHVDSDARSLSVCGARRMAQRAPRGGVLARSFTRFLLSAAPWATRFWEDRASDARVCGGASDALDMHIYVYL